MPQLYQAAAGMNQLEQLTIGNSAIHRLHPMTKLLTTLVYVITVISFPSTNVSGLIPFLLYPVTLMALSDTPYPPLIGRMVVALPFALAGGISNILLMRDTAFQIGQLAISYGAISCTSILLKTLLTVMAVLILIATTSFVEISEQLAALRVPKIFCLQLIMTYRYITVLLDEAVTMFTAYILRSRDRRGIKMKDMGSFLGQLLLRSFDRAQRVYQAMKCRGFEGVYHGKKQSGLTLCGILYICILSIGMIALRLFNLSLFLGQIVK